MIAEAFLKKQKSKVFFRKFIADPEMQKEIIEKLIIALPKDRD